MVLNGRAKKQESKTIIIIPLNSETLQMKHKSKNAGVTMIINLALKNTPLADSSKGTKYLYFIYLSDETQTSWQVSISSRILVSWNFLCNFVLLKHTLSFMKIQI